MLELVFFMAGMLLLPLVPALIGSALLLCLLMDHIQAHKNTPST